MEVLKTHMKKGQSVTVGNYCYLDGDKHVKVSIAMDVISEAVASEYVPQQPPVHRFDATCHEFERYKDRATIAYLCTPTDAHVISKDAQEAQKKNAADSPWCTTLHCALHFTSSSANLSVLC
jgi:hypothetical protein